MKIFLIILNVVLGALVVQQTISLLKPSKEELTLSTKDKDKAKPKTEPRTTEPETTLSTAEAARVVAEQNIFNLDRCPEAASGGRGFQMSLIGVYEVGTEQGAIIEQSRQSTRRNVFREMESMVRGGRGGARGTGDTTTTLLPIKKYFRVGETLENGYTLSSVGTDYAILTRGSSSTRLELQLAGRNINQRSGNRTFQPNQQQVQQMMMMGQLRMMQMMQQQIQQGGGNRAGGTTSNRPRTTR